MDTCAYFLLHFHIKNSGKLRLKQVIKFKHNVLFRFVLTSYCPCHLSPLPHCWWTLWGYSAPGWMAWTRQNHQSCVSYKEMITESGHFGTWCGTVDSCWWLRMNGGKPARFVASRSFSSSWATGSRRRPYWRHVTGGERGINTCIVRLI